MEGTLVLIIPILGIGCGFFAIWTNHRQKIAKIEAVENAKIAKSDAGYSATKFKNLENRVRVLERIVTEGGYDVATQIEALRDEQPAQQHGSGVPLEVNTVEKA